MAELLNGLVFGIYPYIALAVLAVGTVIRYDREPYTWRSGSSQLLRRRQLVWGSIMFHVGVLLIFFGHLGGLLTPLWIWDMLGVSHGAKQMIAIVLGGVAGVIGIIGATLLIHRRFFDARVRAASSFADNMIILILWVQLALGLLTIRVSMQHLDGEEMVKFMSWARGIYTFDLDAAGYITGVSPVFKLHLFLGMTIFLIFPFTRLVHIWSGFASLGYIVRPFQVVRSRRLNVPTGHNQPGRS